MDVEKVPRSAASKDSSRDAVAILNSILEPSGQRQVSETQVMIILDALAGAQDPALVARFSAVLALCARREIELSSQNLLGRYPFTKFAVVENFFPTGYGMPSYTLLGRDVIKLPFIVSTSLGHEIAHNWWGNSVYVDYGGGNWCEGLTTYNADYLYKERKSIGWSGLPAADEHRLLQLC